MEKSRPTRPWSMLLSCDHVSGFPYIGDDYIQIVSVPIRVERKLYIVYKLSDLNEARDTPFGRVDIVGEFEVKDGRIRTLVKSANCKGILEEVIRYEISRYQGL